MDLDQIFEREQAKIGQTLGVSPWHLLDQDRISAFAEVTGDRQFIHVDQVNARKTAFGGTIAHGFLTLSLIATLALETIAPLPGQRLALNYGFEKVRFLSPVPSGSHVRAKFVLQAVARRGSEQLLHTLAVEMALKGSAKPALVATWLSLAVFS